MGFMRPPLPGIYFDPPARANGAELPPLDVAGFVGFADRGPAGLPIAVEDPGYFHAVFGGDLALARTSGGATVFANLPRTVESFFANGGRRAYVVRLTGDAARPGRFRIPGLIADHGFGPAAASIDAASPGRWSSAMRLAARLDALPLPPGGFRWADLALEWRAFAGTALEPGDVLRVALEDGSRWLVPIRGLKPRAEGWQRLVLGPAWPLLTPDGGVPFPEIVDVRVVDPDGSRRLTPPPAAELRGGPRWALSLAGLDEAALRAGDLLSLSLADGRRLLFPVADVRVADAGSPPAAHLVASASEMLSATPGVVAASPRAPLTGVERLRFALAVGRTNIGLPDDLPFAKVIDDLVFNPPGRRFWGDVVWLESSPLFRPGGSEAVEGSRDGATWFRTVLEGGQSMPGREIAPDPAALAGRLAPTPGWASGSLFLPLGMADLLPGDRDDGWTVIRPGEEGYDGLDRFDPTAFIDRALVPELSAPPGGAALMAAAEARHYAQGRRLRGLHSLMFVDELATIALPEAAHPEWIKLPATTRAPASPAAEPSVSPPSAPDRAGFGPCEAPPEAEPPAVVEAAAPTEPDLPDVVEQDGSALLDRLLDLHLALLAVCHARRDLVALLSLPRDFGVRHCLEWRDRLTARLRSGTFGDAVDASGLSYAAVHYPWLVLAGGDQRAVPPEGAVAGIYARRERARGVWVSPANEPVRGVIDLTPQLSADDWARLFEAQLNLVRRGARDFRLMSAHTLSRERSLLQVSVRRLLILVRRLALRRGLDYAFESNHERFREAVRVEFEAMLTQLFERGAFSGRIPEEAFRVITDESVNPPQSVDQGRLVTQIQIAPSQPLAFLIVRLARLGDGLLHAVEPS